MPDREWISTKDALPNIGQVVDTKIAGAGANYEQKLKHNGQFWCSAEDSMRVYYTPTHWRPIATGESGVAHG